MPKHPTWTMCDGQTIRLVDMTTDHLLNVRALLHRLDWLGNPKLRASYVAVTLELRRRRCLSARPSGSKEPA